MLHASFFHWRHDTLVPLSNGTPVAVLQCRRETVTRWKAPTVFGWDRCALYCTRESVNAPLTAKHPILLSYGFPLCTGPGFRALRCATLLDKRTVKTERQCERETTRPEQLARASLDQSNQGKGAPIGVCHRGSMEPCRSVAMAYTTGENWAIGYSEELNR